MLFVFNKCKNAQMIEETPTRIFPEEEVDGMGGGGNFLFCPKKLPVPVYVIKLSGSKI